MNRNPKTERRKVKALTDPRPEFVSLVSAGANMTPFLVVKSEEGVAKSDSHEIVKVTFRSDKYADEAAVKAWLDDGGYEGYDITKTDEGFEVSGKAENEYGDEDLSVIEMDGLSLFVVKRDVPSGELAEKQSATVDAVDGETAAKEEETEEVTHEAAKTEDLTETAEAVEAAKEEQAEATEAAATEEASEKSEVRAKYDDFMAMVSDGKSLEEVMRDAFDGLPPGIYEVMASTYTAMRNNILTGDMEGVRRLGTEFGEMVVNLTSVFPIADMATVQRSELVDALAPEIALAAPVAKAEEAEVTAEAETEAAKTEEAVQPVATEAEVEAEKTEEAPATEVEAPVAEEVSAKSDDLGSNMAALVAAVAQLTTQVGSLHTDLTTKADALAVRVDAIEGRQTRKSADVEEGVQASSKVQKGSTEFQDLALRGALGIARRNL